MQTAEILIVEDDANLREALVDTLEMGGYSIIEADSAEKALLVLKNKKVALVVSDVQMAGMDGLGLLRSIKLNWPSLPVLLMTAFANIKDAVEAMKDGAVDYMAKPFAPEVLLNMVGRYANIEMKKQEIIAEDVKSKNLLKLAAKVANTDANVLILGPSGSGKEVLAKYVHNNSPRKKNAFVAINCAAIPENMLEATLFGYEKGAFTGAINACPGKFEQAQKGTILLDEISEMELNLQAKLLRVIQEREVERLGSRKSIKLDVRIIATSNRDLKQYVLEGNFREDLYYRLNVFPLAWPALAERCSDIIPLAQYLLSHHSKKQNVSAPTLSSDAQKKLLSYSWPGNVRELDNVIQRALILQNNNLITANEILLELVSVEIDSIEVTPVIEEQKVAKKELNINLGSELQNKEFAIILETLEKYQGSRKDVAEELGISPRTLRYKLAKMRDMGIEIP